MSTSPAIELSAAEQAQLHELVRKGTTPARQLNRARFLQFSHQGHAPDTIVALLGVSRATVYNLRRRYRQQGLAAALTEKPRSGQPRKVTPAVEATITSLACTDAPDGSSRWSIRLLRGRLIELGMGVQHSNNFETLRLYVNSEEDADRYTGALVFEVEGDSMEPLLRIGEKVIAWQVPEGKWEQVYNQVCVVAYDDTVTIKAVRENELFTRNLLTLYAQNPAAGFLPVQRQQIQSLWRVEEFFDRPKIRL
ncbi:helix-turn-helix domain-containing protein [Hymenobacter sp. NST-14]|uniref:helix-turn-helix domain-containing protein n=1 Tax=Hymenobacter piscis TaxID=2839984 RepID=UPI001C025FB4|nr:helix-turn-helix domain-containing protein [Hymenobacter piscis]MBT9395343.1 helix-turn-helix domain-containing protein [Hymenobacter piscis]